MGTLRVSAARRDQRANRVSPDPILPSSLGRSALSLVLPERGMDSGRGHTQGGECISHEGAKNKVKEFDKWSAGFSLCVLVLPD